MYRLPLARAKDTQGRWFVNMFFVRLPPNHEALALFLMLNDERCLNSLLLAGLLSSTLARLFWK
jgi:hypothetical protein